MSICFPIFRAIQESLVEYQKGLNPSSDESPDQSSNNNSSEVNDNRCEVTPVPNGRLSTGLTEAIPEANNLELALRLSERERLEEEKRIKEEEELFQQILQLSITDKWFSDSSFLWKLFILEMKTSF